MRKQTVDLFAIATMLVAVMCLVTNIAGAASENLDDVHAKIVAKFPGVEHLEPERLVPMLESSDIILFDVREADEFSVSRLPNAYFLPPKTSQAQFRDAFGDKVKGRTVVFYCSVGFRSSTMATRLQTDLETLGASAVYNLRGGIFAWHNDKRRLADDDGMSEFVHPFDDDWGQLVGRPELLRYSPAPE